MENYYTWEQKAKVVRKWCLVSTTEAGSGHPTSCLSAADLTTALFDSYFHYEIGNPLNPYNDRFILSKGHAAPLLYTLFGMSGAYPLEEIKTLRKFGSRFEGHPTPKYPFADAATGSLGQGLSVGAGLAYLSKKEGYGFRTFVLLGDGEMAEGQVWEGANFSSYYGLDNLVVIADVNRLAQSQETMFGHRIEEYVRRFQAFGFETITIDGHNYSEIKQAFDTATSNQTGKPFAIIAKTYKGKGISFLENADNWHGKALKKEELEKALTELGEVNETMHFQLKKPTSNDLSHANLLPGRVSLSYASGQEIATREVYGDVLAQLAHSNSLIYSLDADVKNSTFSQDFLKAHPERFIECFIAEQNMVGVAMGLSRLGKIPFVSTFASFLVRAADQIRMAMISEANISFAGSHAGVSIGEDGPSQMGLEDFALFGALPGSVIFHPADAFATAKIMPLLVAHKGISYLRTLRSKTPLLYTIDDEFVMGGSKVLRESPEDQMTVVATGITVFEALKAYETLKNEGIMVRVIDCYSIKPIDQATLTQAISQTKKKILITIEDHFEHGGLGDFVLAAVSHTGAVVEKMAVTHVSQSGTKDELLDEAGISATHIVEKVKQLIA